ncbi:MAG: acyl-CoA carboxylase subunit beta [Steroidobacteraceae bacterium]
MTVLESALAPDSDVFRANAQSMLGALEAVRAIEARNAAIVPAVGERLAKRNELSPRQRLDLLLDRGRMFIELSRLAGLGLEGDTDGSAAGGGMILGIGTVCGVRCIVSVDNFVVKGGSLTQQGVLKKIRSQQIASEMKLPVVTLAQSGGANLRYISDFFIEGARFFANRARLSAQGLPQITVVHGSATAGGAYDPGLSDYMIMVRKKASMYLAGPPLLKAATGEIATEEELGGAEMHCAVAGTAEYLAEDDVDGIRIARDVLQALDWNRLVPEPPVPKYHEPLYSQEELLGVLPADPKTPFDMREVLARILDGSEFLEFKGEFDAGTVCGHGAMEGLPVGIVANNYPITARGAAKAAQFIQLCDQAQIPLLFAHNTTGFLVGTEQEQAGIIKHGAKMIQAVANARVPRISLMLGGSYGAGNYAMCGRGLDPQFIFAWPTSRVAVMGGPQAAMVLRIVGENRFQREGRPVDPESRARIEAEANEAERLLEEKSRALYATARLWDDGIIDPRDTRKLIAELLRICRDARHRTLQPNSFGVGRF